LNKIETNISIFKKLPALFATVGLLFVLLHPLQHVVETALFEYDSVHHEIPSDQEDGTNQTDCIECILVSSLLTDFDTSSVNLLNQSDYITAVQSDFLYEKLSEFGFSLRAPPVLYV
jgi:hypothetical protein